MGIVNPNPALEKIVDGFKARLTELCEKQKRTVIFIHPNPLARKEINGALQVMKEKRVDLIFAVTTPAALDAKKFFKKSGTPIVFAPIYDPIRSGVVDNLRGNHGNITGVKIGGSNAKTLEWLIEAAPNAKKILVPFSGKSKVEHFSFADLDKAADKLGIEIQVANVDSEKELSEVLENVPDDINAIWLLHSIFLAPRSRMFVESAIKHKLPLVSGTGVVGSGVMIAYGQNHHSTGAQAGRLAHLVAQGVAPKNLPIETAEFYLHLDLSSADSAGIEIPDEILKHAAHVVRAPSNSDG
ncbi:ABC transporter substrate-binding protein [Pseudomonadota bacterium]